MFFCYSYFFAEEVSRILGLIFVFLYGDVFGFVYSMSFLMGSLSAVLVRASDGGY